MRSILILALALAADVALAGKVAVDRDRLFDFARCRTFAWGEGGTAARSELTQGRIEAAVRRELRERGLTESGTADLMVVTHADSARTIQPAAHVGIGLGRGTGWGGISVGGSRPVGSTTVETTSLVIQIYDTRGGSLVWEARAGEISPDPARLERALDRAVAKAFRQYPRPAKK